MAPAAAARRLHTVRQGLADLGIVNADFFADCTTRNEEFKVIKKQYYRQCLVTHPDKGGSADAFRAVNTAFELLRDLHAGHKQRRNKANQWLFCESLATQEELNTKPSARGSKQQEDDGEEEAFDMSEYDFDFSNQETPSWEFFRAAAEERPPTYRVEKAKSGRSKCKQTSKVGKKCSVRPEQQQQQQQVPGDSAALVDPSAVPEIIDKGELRVGWTNEQSGTYGGWCHLRCWRVPYKVWQGLPRPEKCQDPAKFAVALLNMNHIIDGFAELSFTDRQLVVAHCQDRSHWSTYRKPKLFITAPDRSETANAAAAASPAAAAGAASGASPSTTSLVPSGALVAGRQKFVTPQPGVNGASGPTVFSGKTFVATGTFPEIGGGFGLTLGKDRIKAMIQSSGGRITGSISGKTDVLIVGKDPGMCKVSQARGRPKIVMASLKDLKDGLDAGLASLEEFDFFNCEEPMKIASFSSGYKYSRTGYNGLALSASKTEIAAAQGLKKTSTPQPTEKKAPPEVLVLEDEEKPKAAGKKPPPEVLMIEDDEEPKAAGKKALPEALLIEDEEKPATELSSPSVKKRRALKDVPSSPNVTRCSKTVPKKKRKTAPRSAKNAAPTSSSTAIVVADKPKKKGKTTKAKKTAKAKETDSALEDANMGDIVACDICGSDCTASSWFLAETEADFCPDCHVSEGIEGAVPQRYGKEVQ